MPHDYIPGPDGAFDSFARNFYATLVDWWNAEGLDISQLNDLEKALDAWVTTYPAHVTAKAQAASAAQAKDAARRRVVAAIRPLAQFVQTYATTTDAQRATMGITIRRRGPRSLPPPPTKPLFQIDTSKRLEHTLRITDETTPTRAAKPRGAQGAEVWLKLVNPGEAPTSDPGDMRYLAMTTRTPFSATFPISEGGKTAVYMLRWVSRTGEPGPWSQVMSATVAA